MDTVIGIGPQGCKIAQQFALYPQYDVYQIGVDISGPNCYSLKEYNTPEEYEQNAPDLTQFFSDINGDVLFVIGGGSKVTGACLQIMKQLKHCNLHVLYKRPWTTDLSRTAKLQERLTHNVFQEYARSGVFKKLFLTSEESIEEIIGEVTFAEAETASDKQIVNIMHYINIFNNTDPITDNSEPPKDIARICTFGIQDIKSGEEKTLYPLQNICDKMYYYAIKEDDLKSDRKLIKTIREQLSKNQIQPSYQVHSTKHPESFCYFISYSSRIQSS